MKKTKYDLQIWRPDITSITGVCGRYILTRKKEESAIERGDVN